MIGFPPYGSLSSLSNLGYRVPDSGYLGYKKGSKEGLCTDYVSQLFRLALLQGHNPSV